MYQYTFSLLMLVSVFLFNFPEKGIGQEILKDTISTSEKNTIQKNNSLILSGKYKLKYSNTLKNRKWKPAKSVGLDFVPNTYLYVIEMLIFNSELSEVKLCTVSSTTGLPNPEIGSYHFNIKGKELTVFYGTENFNVKYLIVRFTKSRLILEDPVTKIQWAFYKD